jgi:hypothetical protein
MAHLKEYFRTVWSTLRSIAKTPIKAVKIHLATDKITGCLYYAVFL